LYGTVSIFVLSRKEINAELTFGLVRLFSHIVRFRLYRFTYPWTSDGRKKHLTDMSPIGENPLDKVVVLKDRAGTPIQS
jgi:hypothetical protein